MHRLLLAVYYIHIVTFIHLYNNNDMHYKPCGRTEWLVNCTAAVTTQSIGSKV